MFAKHYKVKSNTSLKNSEKKHLIQRILDEFPSATEEKAKLLVPAKSSCSCMKVTLHSGEAVDVYVVDGAPALIAARGTLLPALPALWRLPDLLPALTIQAPVLPKLQGGAPLYLPGVVLPPGGAGFPMFARGARLAVRTADNAAAAAVGFASLASGEMLLKIGGACLDVVHWAGDALCREPKCSKQERPRLAPPAAGAGDVSDRLAANLTQMHIQPSAEKWPSLGRRVPAPEPLTPAPAPAPTPTPTPTPAPAPAPAPAQPPALAPVDSEALDISIVLPEEPPEPGQNIPEDTDGLLQWALLGFLKLHAKTIELPIKSSLLYRNYILPLCPPDRSLDVKKSSYKKVGKFLEAMQKEGLLEVREVEKGVDAVTVLHAAHPRVRSHAPPAPRAHHAPAPAPPAGDAGAGDDYEPPRVRELFALTAAVVDLFAPLKKGTTLTAAELRAGLTDYVKSRNLAQNKGAVTLDDTLARAANAQPQESLKWEALMVAVQARCTPCTEMRFAGGACTLTKAKLEPIKMQVVNRSGNKKVTLVSNLESFGFSLAELARAWQRGAAAACGVTRAPGSKRDQLLLQGDQTYFVARLLIEKYGLPKKFVEGADKALKKKKGT